MEPVKACKLWSETYEALRREILAMSPGENRLPSEEELSRQLGVSRATVREALQALVREGYVTRRQGKGNYGHPSVEGLRHRFDLSADFMDLFGAGGREVVCQPLRSGAAPAGPAMCSRFPGGGGPVFFQEWRYDLEGAPIILCRVETPAALLPPDPPLPGDCRLVGWLSALAGLDVAYYAAHVGCRGDAAAAGALDLPPATVMLNWQEILYDIHDAPVSFCDLFFHPEHTDLSMVLRF